MNRDRAKELLPIIEAFANGDGVEYRPVGCGDKPWRALDDYWNMTETSMSRAHHDYRIKPKAREFWLCWEDEGSNDSSRFPIPEYVETSVDHWNNYIKVREVLE